MAFRIYVIQNAGAFAASIPLSSKLSLKNRWTNFMFMSL